VRVAHSHRLTVAARYPHPLIQEVSTVSLRIAQNEEADQLVSEDPLALLIAMVLDQQIPLERAFTSPLDLKTRLGGRLDAEEIAAMDPDKLAAVFSARPALHRFPAANAKRVQELCGIIVSEYHGHPAEIWEQAASGEDLLRRVRALPGFGEQKARIFVGLLGKQLGVRPPGWEEAAGRYGVPGTFLSVADIVDSESLARVRAYKAQLKAAARDQA
jgi:uncharacterized HhH-GPD family protein